ncbi:hypothetical protein AVEN_66323-1 [Araneus ventricosus]|uniref:Histone-lysine N-methyltransferase SETMAR n=1 Tax=Araneus ventricosus TaxID=182803 RepID=A0A4Y2H4L5_ARAVE|nr:hypothetical protein AVEN_66323-1 [Araneus ventricosus]
MRRLGWARLDLPAYSPDLALSDFHLFLHLSQHYRYGTSEAMKKCSNAVKNFLLSLCTDFYQDGFLKLISRYGECINVGGEYVEK